MAPGGEKGKGPILDLSRILIIKPSSLGDVVQALPVAWALRDLKPDARIDWLVTPGCAGVVEGLAAIDHVFPFDRGRFGRMWRNPLSAMEFVWFLGRLRRVRYTTVVDLQGLFRSGFLSWASGAATRLGLANSREGAERFYTDIVKLPPGPLSAIDRYFEAAVALGVPREAAKRFDVFIPPEKAVEARELLKARGLAEGRRYVVLVPGARWQTKRWPEERFAALANRIHEKLDLAPVLVGAPSDREIADRMVQMQGRHLVDVIGRTDLKVLAAVLQGAECVVTNDTGPMHLASALGRPILAIFGSTDAALTGPYGADNLVLGRKAACAPCLERSCQFAGQQQELICLRSITVDEVFECLRQMLRV
jgi:lipopolysaccharide heptosyltransferase I